MRATYANTSLHNTSRFARRPEFAHVSPSTCRAVRYFLSRKDIGIGSNGRLSPSLSLSVSAGLTSFLRNGSRQEIVDRLPIVARETRPPFNKFPSRKCHDLWKSNVSISGEYRSKLSAVLFLRECTHRLPL